MEDIPVDKKVLDFKGIQFLLAFYDFQRSNLPLFGDQGNRGTFFKDADLRHHHSDFPVEFFHHEVVHHKFDEILLFFALTQL